MQGLDLDLNVGFLLHDVSRLMRASFDQRAQALGLTRAQWRVLVHLAPRQGTNQSALADILELDVVTMGRHIDRLQRDGWLERRPDPGDRRAWLLYLTEAAQPTLDRMDAIATEMQAAALDGLSPAERERLTATLLRIKANLAASPDAAGAAAGGPPAARATG
jgi:MarR family transcriptional regulator, transcriptional regulator for hemolysin